MRGGLGRVPPAATPPSTWPRAARAGDDAARGAGRRRAANGSAAGRGRAAPPPLSGEGRGLGLSPRQRLAQPAPGLASFAADGGRAGPAAAARHAPRGGALGTPEPRPPPAAFWKLRAPPCAGAAAAGPGPGGRGARRRPRGGGPRPAGTALARGRGGSRGAPGASAPRPAVPERGDRGACPRRGPGASAAPPPPGLAARRQPQSGAGAARGLLRARGRRGGPGSKGPLPAADSRHSSDASAPLSEAALGSRRARRFRWACGAAQESRGRGRGAVGAAGVRRSPPSPACCCAFCCCCFLSPLPRLLFDAPLIPLPFSPSFSLPSPRLGGGWPGRELRNWFCLAEQQPRGFFLFLPVQVRVVLGMTHAAFDSRVAVFSLSSGYL